MASSFLTVDEYKKGGGRVFDGGKRMLGRSMDRVKEMACEAAEGLEDLREEARHELYETRRTIQKNPLLSVGIGIAAGAALGAILGYTISKIDWKASDVEERFI